MSHKTLRRKASDRAVKHGHRLQPWVHCEAVTQPKNFEVEPQRVPFAVTTCRACGAVLHVRLRDRWISGAAADMRCTQ